MREAADNLSLQLGWILRFLYRKPIFTMGEKPKKEKKAKKEVEDVKEAVEKKVVLAPIAKPLADEKLEKKASAT